MYFSWKHECTFIITLAAVCRLIYSSDAHALDRMISLHQDHRRLPAPPLTEKNQPIRLALFHVIVHIPESELSHWKDSQSRNGMRKLIDSSTPFSKSSKSLFLFHKNSECCLDKQIRDFRANKNLLLLPKFARVLFDRIGERSEAMNKFLELPPLSPVRLSSISIDPEGLIDLNLEARLWIAGEELDGKEAIQILWSHQNQSGLHDNWDKCDEVHRHCLLRTESDHRRSNRLLVSVSLSMNWDGISEKIRIISYSIHRRLHKFHKRLSAMRIHPSSEDRKNKSEESLRLLLSASWMTSFVITRHWHSIRHVSFTISSLLFNE